MNQLFRWDQMGLFLLALAAGILPFAVPEVCAAALREGLTLCSGPLLLSLFPFLVVSRLLVQCPESDLLALPFRLAAWGIGIRTPCAARVLCIGFLGGFAPAASAAAQAVRTGQLTAEEADAQVILLTEDAQALSGVDTFLARAAAAGRRVFTAAVN